jgi:hypothetical protein
VQILAVGWWWSGALITNIVTNPFDGPFALESVCGEEIRDFIA